MELAALIGSEGNKSGMHNFPIPDSEIPRIIENIIR